MLCADVPASPAAPALLLRSLDLILVTWEPPASDGGTPVLGYAVLMKESASSTYTMIYNGTQNPATRSLAIKEFNGAALATESYDIVL